MKNLTCVLAAATLPDTGCDIGGLLGDGIIAMGAIAAVAAGGYVAFKIIKRGLRWCHLVFSDSTADSDVEWIPVRLSGNKTEYLKSWDADAQRVEGRLKRGKTGQLWRVY